MPELKLPLSAECKLESGHEAMRGERISENPKRPQIADDGRIQV